MGICSLGWSNTVLLFLLQNWHAICDYGQSAVINKCIIYCLDCWYWIVALLSQIAGLTVVMFSESNYWFCLIILWSDFFGMYHREHILPLFVSCRNLSYTWFSLNYSFHMLTVWLFNYIDLTLFLFFHRFIDIVRCDSCLFVDFLWNPYVHRVELNFCQKHLLSFQSLASVYLSPCQILNQVDCLLMRRS